MCDDLRQMSTVFFYRRQYESDSVEILGLYIYKYDEQTYLANKSILRLKNLMFNYS